MANYEEQLDGFTSDVFLSFRGEDTRHNIVGYLLDAFEKRRINVFYDDKKLEVGEDISTALGKAIEESNISVIVLSENYASSRWCLNELAKIMECTATNEKQIAFPIFYHVDPSDVRHQRNSYGKAMVAHKDRFGKDSEKLKAWTEALSDVANLKGHHIDTGFEINHVKEIAEKVHAKIAPKSLLVGEYPVGLEHHIEDAKSLLDLNPNVDIVCMLGIYGLGGIGKTSLAKALYNKIAHQFQAACFLANVREKSNNIKGLEDLQQTLLSEMFEQSDSKLGSTSRGINEIKVKLGKKKVLLVLDDVNEMEQLDNLAGGSDWFGPGSRIIITTRDKGLLIATHQIEVKTYEMIELNDQHSLELFCRYAFGKSNPKSGYEAISSRVVGYAKGLPLALKVIGSNLATRKSLKAWDHALKDYERIPRKGMQDVLKVSYDVLEPYAQSVFLDIACFFKGKRIEYVEEILDEFSAASNIEELVNKSLLNVDNGYLNMHDLIQDMGREIVRQEAPNNPAKRSRLWLQQDVIDVLSANDSGSDAIQGIMLDPPNYVRKVYLNASAFEKMNSLRILIVRHTTFSSEPKHLPDHLRLLEWDTYPSKTFPPQFYPRNIIILNLLHTQLITMEQPFKQFSYLTVMNFSFSSITTMPDVSNVKNLRELRLVCCWNLTTVHESIGFLKHLVLLSAKGCRKLKNFLQRMYLPSLEFLDLSSCENLEHFPDILNEMNKPLKICMSYTSIKKLPNSVGNLIGLVSIDMLNELPCTIQKINARGCFNLSRETRNMLWDQMKKKRHGLEIVMPRQFKVPKWFDYKCKGGIPCLWVREKFPINVAFALVFQAAAYGIKRIDLDFVKLHLVINGQSVPHKGYYNFDIRHNHVLVCDLRLLCNDEEWLSLDALLLKYEWNQVQISYEFKYSPYEALDWDHIMTLSEWGVFVYKQGGTVNLEEHVQFMCPDPTSRYDAENEEFQQNSEEIQDLMSATYLNGPRDGVLEAQPTLLSLNMDKTTSMFEENEEHFTHDKIYT
ncbi:TMV resistance protein N [Trifolium pratense]|uniref:TMV resistance protein N n=1 Tax=Trifolium pratense TaxID=57577 RepID=A0A2K3P3Q3_TRIPR|nr:TMV resistance protein N [Trifolium pratense]